MEKEISKMDAYWRGFWTGIALASCILGLFGSILMGG